MLTKGKMIQTLKKQGIRRGDKGSAIVKLEHFNTPDVIMLYFTYCK